MLDGDEVITLAAANCLLFLNLGTLNIQELMVLAHQDVIEKLLDEESAALAELEVHTGKPIRLQTEALYQQDQYDVVLM